MKATPLRPLLAALLALAVVGCDSGDDDLIDPGDADAVTGALVFGNRAERIEGDAPAPTDDPASPDIVDAAASASIEPGGQIALPIDIDGERPISGFYLQVTDAASYFDIAYEGAPLEDGETALTLSLPDEVDEGEFVVNYCVYVVSDDEGGELVSNVVSTTVNVRRRGAGAGEVEVSGAVTSSFEGPAYAFIDESQQEDVLFVYVFDEPFGSATADEFVLLLVSDPAPGIAVSLESPGGDRFAGASYSNVDGAAGVAASALTGTVTLDAFSDEAVRGSFDVEGPALRFTGGDDPEELGDIRFRGSFSLSLTEDPLPGFPSVAGAASRAALLRASQPDAP